ncbi:hypothetical protein K456DRAFT_1428855 [Colletotrichum gloeosporioides 23]|nr:hypothetical protein K456DRAFT_1428855 [Colletotrichum gloeosporioides 23]
MFLRSAPEPVVLLWDANHHPSQPTNHDESYFHTQENRYELLVLVNGPIRESAEPDLPRLGPEDLHKHIASSTTLHLLGCLLQSCFTQWVQPYTHTLSWAVGLTFFVAIILSLSLPARWSLLSFPVATVPIRSLGHLVKATLRGSVDLERVLEPSVFISRPVLFETRAINNRSSFSEVFSQSQAQAGPVSRKSLSAKPGPSFFTRGLLTALEPSPAALLTLTSFAPLLSFKALCHLLLVARCYPAPNKHLEQPPCTETATAYVNSCALRVVRGLGRPHGWSV